MNIGPEMKKGLVRGGFVLFAAVSLSAAIGESGVAEDLDAGAGVAASFGAAVVGGTAAVYATNELGREHGADNPEIEHAEKTHELLEETESERR